MIVLQKSPPVNRMASVAGLLFCLTVFVGAIQAESSASPPPGFTLLFDEKSLDGWHGRPHIDPYLFAKWGDDKRLREVTVWSRDAKEHWRIESGELINDGQGAYLTTNYDFGDMELHLEYRTVAKADSGVYLRGCPQVQIWDFTEAGGKWNLGADKGSGGLWNNSPGTPGKNPLVLADKPFGEWNRLVIQQVGERTSVALNERQTVRAARMENFWDRSKPLPPKGPIQLQTHGGEILWRKLFIKEIAPSEANDLLRGINGEGFRDLIQGDSLASWRGALESYEVKDGAIVCKAGKTGFLFTEEEFSDAVVRLEFRLPAGGNSGVALRYPKSGRASTEGWCEIQLLDDDHTKYQKIDSRQSCGSAYGLAAAHRGYLRPTGEWNFMEIQSVGQQVAVEMNGVKILDADLGGVEHFMSTKPYHGRGRKKGSIAICGHRDPVEIRRLQVKPLAKRIQATTTPPIR